MIKKLMLKDLSDESYSCNDEITTEKLATRKIFSNLLNDLKDKERLICGSADLASSVLCKLNEGNDFTNENFKGNYINFGIREHAMCGVMTGIASHGFYMPICGTFLNFIAYGYPSVRLASLDKLNTVYVLSHDSICLGEDGPTHQPIETLLTLRSTPNLITMRPCDIKECKAALNVCLSKQGPKAVILTRQKVPFIEHTCKSKALKGAYYLIEHPNPDLIIIGTGSEIELCYQVLDELKELNISLVSFFSWELFEEQEDNYKKSILKNVPKVSLEALTTFGWHKYSDLQIGLDNFRYSGKCADVYKFAGFDPKIVSEKIRKFIKK